MVDPQWEEAIYTALDTIKSRLDPEMRTSFVSLVIKWSDPTREHLFTKWVLAQKGE